MKKIIISLFVIFFVIFTPVVVNATGNTDAADTTEEIVYPKTTEFPDDPDRCPVPAGEHVIVMDASTGQILYEKDAYSKAYPASITKIMTALLAVENGDLSSTVTMSEDAVWGIERDSSHIALDVGEQITLEQALYAVMLKSANEAAWAVAEHIGGSLENFCQLMNKKAEEIGCVNSHFVNANGLHDDNHYTCAYDMALIAKEALKNQTFNDITSQTFYNIPPTNKNDEERNLWQDNKLIKPDSDFYYEYCQGGKTGFTDQALGTLVCWAKKDDVQLICVSMGCRPTSNCYTDSKALFEYYFNNFSYQKPLVNFSFTEDDLQKAENCLNEYFNGTNDGNLSLSVDTNAILLIKNTNDLTFTPNFFKDDTVGNTVGELIISSGEETLAKLPISYSGYISVPSTTDNNSEASKHDSDVFSPEVGSNDANEKDSHPIIIVLIVILAGVTFWLFIHMQKVKKQRLLYKKKRDLARKHGRSIK